MTTPVPPAASQEQPAHFTSSGLRLAGVVRIPPGRAPGERRPAFLVLHGFGSHKGAGNVLGPCAVLESLGYVTLRFDMRGCGDSEGVRGNLICLEQVEDTRAALTFLAGHPAVDPARIALVGSSFGAAVAVYTAGVDDRVAAVISSGGWGHGEIKFRGQHPGEAAWARFTAMLAEGRRHHERTGESMMVPRMDIVPVRHGLTREILPGSLQSFTAETAQSMFDFRAEDVVSAIAPRPLLLLHSSFDTVTPTEQSLRMFARAKPPVDLHLFGDTDHFMLAEGNQRVWNVVRDWLGRYFPVTP